MSSNLILEPYQQKARDVLVPLLLSQGRAALSAPIGSGKTAIIYSVIADLIGSCAAEKVLIVAPRNVAVDVYPKEANKWKEFNWLWPHILHGTDKSLAPRSESVTVTTYDTLQWLADSLGWTQKKVGKPIPWDTVIFDESHFMKDSTTKRFQRTRGMFLGVPRKLIVTGTLMGNSLLDLWAQYFLLDGGETLLRQFDDYKVALFVPVGDGDARSKKWVPRSGAVERILDRVAPITHVIGEDEVEKPKATREIVWCELDPVAREAHDRMERTSFLSLGAETIEAWNAVSLTAKLRQIAAGFAYHPPKAAQDSKRVVTGIRAGWSVIHRAKIEKAVELLKSVDSPVMIVANFDGEFEMLREAFPDLRVIKGGMSVRDVRATINEWNDKRIKRLAIHPKSAGVGLNLQHGGSRQLWMGPDWSFLARNQTEGRVLRKGQEEDVVIQVLVCANTVDEIIQRAANFKEDALSAFLHGLNKRRKEVSKRWEQHLQCR